MYKNKSIAKPSEDGLVGKLGKQGNSSKEAWNEKTGKNATVVRTVIKNSVGKDKDLVKEHCDRYPHCVPCFVNIESI